MMNRIFVNKIVSAAIICIILINIMGTCISFADVDENFILPPSDGSVVTEKNAGINALVLKRGNDELAASLMAQYSYEQPTADKYSLDINFSFTKGSTFQVRNWNLVSWHACFSVDNGKLMFFDTEVDEWEQFCKITSDEIHSLKYEIIGENSMNIYFDGTLVKSNVYKPDGKPSAFSAYMTGKNSMVNIYRYSVTGTNNSFSEDFDGDTIETLKNEGWTFPDMSAYPQSSQSVVNMLQRNALRFEAGERAQTCVVTNSEYSMNGQPASVSLTFRYDAGAEFQIRILNASGQWVAAFHFNNNIVTHQSGAGFETITSLEPNRSYTLKLTCDTFTQNTVNVYFDDVAVAQNKAFVSSDAIAPKYIQVLNLSTDENLYVEKLVADTSEWFKNDYAGKGFAPKNEDYTIAAASACDWSATDGKNPPDIIGVGADNCSIKLKRISTGNEYTASYKLNSKTPVCVDIDFSYEGAGVIGIKGNNTVAVKLENGYAYAENCVQRVKIGSYNKHSLKFLITDSILCAYIDGKVVISAAAIKDISEICFINTAYEETSGPNLFSELCVYSLQVKELGEPDISVISAKLCSVSDKRRVYNVQNESVNCELKLKNSGCASAVHIMAGVYEGDRLFDFIYGNVFVDENSTVTYSGELPAYQNADDLNVKIMVWDLNLSPVFGSANVDRMICSDDFEIYKCYFEQAEFESCDDDFEFKPACGKVDLNITLSSAVDITLYNAERMSVLEVEKSEYSAELTDGGMLTLFVDTDKDGYSLFIDGRQISDAKALDTSTDNIASISVGKAGSIKGISVAFSDKSLSNSVINSENPSYFYNFDSGIPSDLNCVGGVSAHSGYITLKKTATGSGTQTGIIQSFEKPVGGTAEVSFKFKTNGTRSGTEYRLYTNVTRNRAQSWLRIIGGKLMYSDVNGDTHTISGTISDDVWHSMKIVSYVTRCAMDVYVDNECVAREISGRSRYFTDIDDLEIYIPDSSTGNMALDDLFIGMVTEFKSPQGYSDYASAPQLKDLIVPKGPTGQVYYASDMLLDNYSVIAHDAAVKDAVRVESEGAGRASFYYSGNSGYYKINVGYLESNEMADSSYRIYHNNKEIDFWYGKYDDGGRHVRSVTDCMYVKNGDRFIVEGYSSGDGSIFNYVEFISTQHTVASKGTFIDDEYWNREIHKPTSWMVDDRNAMISSRNADKCFEIRDESNIRKMYAKRPFKAVSDDNIVLDFVLDFDIDGDGAIIKVGNSNSDAMTLTVKSGKVFYKSNTGALMAVASVSGWKGVRIILDTKSYTYSIISASKHVSGLKFENNIDYLDLISVETEAKAVGSLYLKSVTLSCGYLCNDDFKVYTRDVLPKGWSAQTQGGGVFVCDSAAEMLDKRSLKLSDTSSQYGVIAEKTFPSVSDELTVSCNVLLKPGITISAGDAITITADNSDIYCNGHKIWENYKANVWYKICAELSFAGKYGRIYVNNIKKLDMPISSESVASVCFSTNDNAVCEVYVDDVIIEDSIYRSPIEEPIAANTGEYDVAVQACDIWREGTHFGWSSIRPYDYSTPLGGYYDDGSKEQADLEIKWMSEHGINVYMPCWFRSSNNTKTPLYGEKLDALLSSPYIDKIKFSIVFENSGGINSADDFMENILPYWTERYFKHPSYYLVDNKPLIFIWNADKLLNDLGGDVSVNAELFGSIEQRLKEEGFDGAVFVTNTMSSKYVSEKLLSCGYDYTYVYSYRNRSAEEQIAIQHAQNAYGYMDALPCLSQGWGSEPWGLGVRKQNMPLAKWYGALKYYKDVYMPAMGENSLASKLVVLDNWNEWGEGHSIYPSNYAGFGYLDAVREIFAGDSSLHEEYLPGIQSNLYVH